MTCNIFSSYSALRETSDEKLIWEDITGLKKPNVQAVFHLHQIFSHSFFRNLSTNEQKHTTVHLQQDRNKECKMLQNETLSMMLLLKCRQEKKTQSEGTGPIINNKQCKKQTCKTYKQEVRLIISSPPLWPNCCPSPNSVFCPWVHKEFYRPVRGRRKIQIYW